MIFDIAKIFLILMIPLAPGYLLMKLLFRGTLDHGAINFMIGLSLGHSMLSSLHFLVSLLKIPISLFSFMTLAFLTTTSLLVFYFKLKQTKTFNIENASPGEKKPFAFKIIFIFLILNLLFIGTQMFSTKVSDMPGIAVWGYKTKVIYFSGNCLATIKNHESIFSHREYPLGYPLMLALCPLVLGEWKDYLIKCTPFLWTMLSLASIYSVGTQLWRSKTFSLLFTLFVSTTGNFLTVSTKMYAEPILITLILLGSFSAYKFLELQHKRDERGWLALCLLLFASAGWYKSEGVMYFLVCISFLLFFSFKRLKLVMLANKKYFSMVFLLSSSYLLPWLLTKKFHSLSSIDFSMDGFNINNLRDIMASYVFEAVYNFNNLGFLTFVLFILTAGSLFFKKRDALPDLTSDFFIVTGLASMGIFFLAYFFSTIPLWWHLIALPRILLIPELLLLYGLSMRLRTPHVK